MIKKKRQAYSDSLIPPRYRNAKLETLIATSTIKLSAARQNKAINLIKAAPLDGYVFLGPTGVGKTHLMYALVDYAIQMGRRVVALTCSQFIKESRDYEFSKEMTPALDADLIASFTHTEAPRAKTLHIFLDEMDKVKLSDYSQLVLFDLVNSAYDYPDRIKLTITSNLPPNRFEEVYGSAFHRKMYTMSKFIVYGED